MSDAFKKQTLGLLHELESELIPETIQGGIELGRSAHFLPKKSLDLHVFLHQLRGKIQKEKDYPEITTPETL